MARDNFPVDGNPGWDDIFGEGGSSTNPQVGIGDVVSNPPSNPDVVDGGGTPGNGVAGNSFPPVNPSQFQPHPMIEPEWIEKVGSGSFGHGFWDHAATGVPQWPDNSPSGFDGPHSPDWPTPVDITASPHHADASVPHLDITVSGNPVENLNLPPSSHHADASVPHLDITPLPNVDLHHI